MAEPKITEGDMKILRAVAIHMDIKIEGDWEKVREYLGHKNVNVTRAIWGAFRKKLKPTDGTETPKPRGKKRKDIEEENDDPSTPTKRVRKSSKKQLENDEDDEYIKAEPKTT